MHFWVLNLQFVFYCCRLHFDKNRLFTKKFLDCLFFQSARFGKIIAVTLLDQFRLFMRSSLQLSHSSPGNPAWISKIEILKFFVQKFFKWSKPARETLSKSHSNVLTSQSHCSGPAHASDFRIFRSLFTKQYLGSLFFQIRSTRSVILKMTTKFHCKQWELKNSKTNSTCRSTFEKHTHLCNFSIKLCNWAVWSVRRENLMENRN